MERPRLKKPSTERCFFMSGFAVGMEKMEIVCDSVCVFWNCFVNQVAKFLGGVLSSK